MTLELRPSTTDSTAGQALLDAFASEIRRLYDADLNGPDMPTAGPQDLAPPAGGFWVGFEEESAVCCGGLKRLSDDAVEIKRMYVVPGRRGEGIGGRLLAHLLDEARVRGYRWARLDTGDQQETAKRLYERAGFQPVDNFNGHPWATYFGQLQL